MAFQKNLYVTTRGQSRVPIISLIPFAMPLRSIELCRQEEILQDLSCQRAHRCSNTVVLFPSNLVTVADGSVIVGQHDNLSASLILRQRQGLVNNCLNSPTGQHSLPISMYAYIHTLSIFTVFSLK